MIPYILKWSDAITEAETGFENAGISDARTNAEYLALSILGIWNRSDLQKKLSEPVTKDQEKKYKEFITRRIDNEPLQHIIGETEFYGLRLRTSSAALIPRPDTEILVEEALHEATSVKGPRILDIGTGSGAIALALASKLPDASIIGIDISDVAIVLANENKNRLQIVNASFSEMDISNDSVVKSLRSFDLIVSNPPYISILEFEVLESEVRDFDPRIALTDEADGFSFYRRIAEIAPKLLNPNGRILVEVGYNGILQVEKIFTDAGFSVLRKVKDLQGIERVLVIEQCVS